MPAEKRTILKHENPEMVTPDSFKTRAKKFMKHFNSRSFSVRKRVGDTDYTFGRYRRTPEARTRSGGGVRSDSAYGIRIRTRF